MDIDTIGQHLYPLTTNICILEALAGVRVGTANMHKTISRHFVGTVRGAHGDPYTWLKAWDRFVKQARALDARYNLESWRDWLAFGFGTFPAYATTAALLRRHGFTTRVTGEISDPRLVQMLLISEHVTLPRNIGVSQLGGVYWE